MAGEDILRGFGYDLDLLILRRQHTLNRPAARLNRRTTNGSVPSRTLPFVVRRRTGPQASRGMFRIRPYAYTQPASARSDSSMKPIE